MSVRRFPGRFPAVAGVATALVVAAVLAVLGGLFLPPGALIAIGVVSLAFGCLAWGKVRETEPDRRRFTPGESGLMAGAATAVAVLVVAGLAVLAGGPAAALITGVLVLGAVGVALGRAHVTRRRQAAVAATPAVPLAVLRPVGSLTTEALGREWLLSSTVLRSLLDVAARQAVVRRRQEVLDELERRDPAGFVRWMADGRPDSDPARYLHASPAADDRGDSTAA